MATFRVLPIFTLFRVRSSDIHQKYLTGHINAVKLLPLTQKVAHVKESFKEIISDNHNKPIFTSVGTGKKNTSDIFATTNSVKYEILHDTGKLPPGGRCWYCRTDFEQAAIGIPFHVETFYDNGQLVSGFHVDGIFHDFRCALKYLRQYRYYEGDQECEMYLFNMFRLMYPDAPPLTEANDFRLLAVNGGPLSWEKWSDSNFIYIETPRLIMLPFKRTFYQSKIVQAT